jgi:hypothetical protein
VRRRRFPRLSPVAALCWEHRDLLHVAADDRAHLAAMLATYFRALLCVADVLTRFASLQPCTTPPSRRDCQSSRCRRPPTTTKATSSSYSGASPRPAPHPRTPTPGCGHSLSNDALDSIQEAADPAAFSSFPPAVAWLDPRAGTAAPGGTALQPVGTTAPGGGLYLFAASTHRQQRQLPGQWWIQSMRRRRRPQHTPLPSAAYTEYSTSFKQVCRYTQENTYAVCPHTPLATMYQLILHGLEYHLILLTIKIMAFQCLSMHLYYLNLGVCMHTPFQKVRINTLFYQVCTDTLFQKVCITTIF